MVEKTRETIIPKNTQIVPAKKCWDKNRRKILRKNFFYIHTTIVTKKWGGKTREAILTETQQIVRAKNV